MKKIRSWYNNKGADKSPTRLIKREKAQRNKTNNEKFSSNERVREYHKWLLANKCEYLSECINYNKNITYSLKKKKREQIHIIKYTDLILKNLPIAPLESQNKGTWVA